MTDLLSYLLTKGTSTAADVKRSEMKYKNII